MNDSKTIEQIIKDMEKLQERYRKKAEKEQTPSEAMLEMLEKIIKGLHTEKSFMEEEQEA